MRPMRSRCIFTSWTFPSAVFLFFLMNSEANVNIFCYVMSFSNEAGSAMQLTMNLSLVVYPFSRTLSRKLVVSFDAALLLDPISPPVLWTDFCNLWCSLFCRWIGRCPFLLHEGKLPLIHLLYGLIQDGRAKWLWVPHEHDDWLSIVVELALNW